MQVNELKERFIHFEHCVEEAMTACQQDTHVSPQLSSTLQNLDREVHRVHDMICSAQQESDELVECIDRLEDMGDDAKRACQSSSGLDRKTQSAVMDLHQEISSLKHQLH